MLDVFQDRCNGFVHIHIGFSLNTQDLLELTFELRIGQLLNQPQRVVAEAKDQSTRLQNVCRAVRKIFAGLSQATLQANQRIEWFDRMSRTNQNRAQRLSAETARTAETLKAWRQRFLARREEVLALFDERFVRMWDFYLAGMEAAFRYDGIMVFQIQMSKRLDTLPMTRNYIGEREAMLRTSESRRSALRLAGE